MQARPVAQTQALGRMASSCKRNGNAAASRASATTAASPLTRLPPTVTTHSIQNLPLWVALPSLLQVNQRRPLRRLSRDPDRVGKLTCNPSPQVCNLDRVVTQHTSTAVDSIPDPSVDLVRISAALTSHSEVLFLISLTLPGLSDPVSALIDSGATSNFLDSSLAASPPFVLEPLDRPIALCLFDGKPATAGFIHESVNTSISFTDHLTQSLALLVTKLHPSSPIVLGLPWLQSTNPTIDWLALSLTFKTGPRSALPSLALARACSTAALRHEDIISDLSPAFDSIPELCTSSGPSILTKVVPIAKMTPSVKLGPFSSNSAPPLGSIPWNRPGFVPPELMHLWDPLSPWFSASDKFSPTAGGVPTPATIFPLLREDHINN